MGDHDNGDMVAFIQRLQQFYDFQREFRVEIAVGLVRQNNLY